MAWSTPATWTAGAVLTAAQLNAQLRDNLNAAFPLGVDAWTPYTPTLTQSGAVTKTVTSARYQRVGRLIVFAVDLAVTGTGTANNSVLVGLPVPAADANGVWGTGSIFDASANTFYPGILKTSSTTAVGIFPGGPSVVAGAHFLGLSAFTAALASADLVRVGGIYESAT